MSTLTHERAEGTAVPSARSCAPAGPVPLGIVSYSIAAIDTSSHQLVASIPGGANPCGIAKTPGGTRLYITNSGASEVSVLDTRQDTVSVIDTRSHRVIARTRVGRTPWQVALSPDGARVYVTGANADTVTVIDTADNTVLRTVRVNHPPTGITATESTIWVSANASSTVDAIDARTLSVLASTPLGLSTEPSGVVVA
ncbi:hypothetical protein ABZ746_32425 [Streptomyces sp. NPDC020096]